MAPELQDDFVAKLDQLGPPSATFSQDVPLFAVVIVGLRRLLVGAA